GSRPVVGGKVSPDGAAEITCDLPAAEKKRNASGRDGSGLCVFTSIEWAARWQNERRLFDFQKQMRAEPGGGWPQKVDRMIAQIPPGGGLRPAPRRRPGGPPPRPALRPNARRHLQRPGPALSIDDCSYG